MEEEEGHEELFKPQLSEGTMNLINQRRQQQLESGKKIITFEELYAQAKKIQKRKDEKREQREKELKQKELEEVTFKPLIKSTQSVVKKQAKEYVPSTAKTATSYLKQHFKQQYLTKNASQTNPIPEK